MDVVRDVLDKGVIDRNGREMGRVDGILLEQQPNQPVRLAAVLIGPAALGDRLHPALGRLVRRIDRRFGVDQNRPARVDFADIDHIETKVRVRLAISDTAVAAVEQKLRSWLPQRVTVSLSSGSSCRPWHHRSRAACAQPDPRPGGAEHRRSARRPGPTERNALDRGGAAVRRRPSIAGVSRTPNQGSRLRSSSDRGQAREGQKDRRTMLPTSVEPRLTEHLEGVRRQHQRDLLRGFGRVVLPAALERKYPNSATECNWQFVFPAARICHDPDLDHRPAITCTSRSFNAR